MHRYALDRSDCASRTGANRTRSRLACPGYRWARWPNSVSQRLHTASVATMSVVAPPPRNGRSKFGSASSIEAGLCSTSRPDCSATASSDTCSARLSVLLHHQHRRSRVREFSQHFENVLQPQRQQTHRGLLNQQRVLAVLPETVQAIRRLIQLSV